MIRNGECAGWASLSGEHLDVLTLADDHGRRFGNRVGSYVGSYVEATESFFRVAGPSTVTR